MYLPPDDDHPPRLDVPVLRHLTFSEVHALELGAYLGVLVAWGIIVGEQYAAFGVAVAAARKIMSHRQSRGDGGCDHDIGFHDVVAEPHYFGTAAVFVGAFALVIPHLVTW